jgi:FAD/FMN-containing dehydrogenase
MSLSSDIQKFFKGEVEEGQKVLDEYSHDASLFEVKPEVVVFPKDSQDIQKLVSFVSDERKKGKNISLTARSAGTDMSGGPLTESIVVECLRHMNHVKEVGNDYAITEPGVFYHDFEKETLKKNLILPSYPASREICAMGGIVANNSGGEKTLTYGKTENYVEEIKMVLSDGNEYSFKSLTGGELGEVKRQDTIFGKIHREMFDLIFKNYDLLKKAKPNVSKNSAGYYLWNVYNKGKNTFDLSKMIVGSQGTLGIITEAKLRLVKPKPFSRLLIVFLKDLSPLASVAGKILEYKPESFESFDDHTFKIAMKVLPSIMRRLTGNMIKLAFDFIPEFFMVLSGGVPKLILLAEFTGDTEEEALQKAMKAEESLKEFHLKSKVTKTEAEAQKYWVFRRESFNLLRHRLSGLRTAPFIDDFVVRPEFLPEFLPKLDEILSHYKVIYTIAGHVGDGNFHLIPLMDMKKDESVRIIKELSEKVYKLVLSYKGTITGEHNDGLIRSSYLEMMYGKEVCDLFAETKKIFDPLNIFNPGKKVNASRKYEYQHVNRS